MTFFKHLRRLSDEEVRSLVAFCSGVALLIGVAVVLSGTGSLLPQSLKVTLQQNTSSQSAAAWSSSYSSYGGWPAPHFFNGANSQFWGFGYPSLPSYFDAYVTDTPSQKIVASVVLPGLYSPCCSWKSYQGPTYSGLIPTVPAGTAITLDWACQDYQGDNYSTGGTCRSYDAFDNCSSWSGGGASTAYAYDYRPAVGTNFTAGTNVGSATVYPTQTTTYSVYCPADSRGNAGYWIGRQFSSTVITMPQVSFTVTVGGGPPSPPPLPTETIDAGAGNGITKTVTAGTPVTITATYAAGAGDILMQTAIDGPNNTNSVPGVPFSAPFSPKQYVFTPSTAGSYIFYPSLQSGHYSVWNNYGASVTVVATTPTCSGAHQVNPPTCSCDIGYTMQNGSCVLATCSDAHAIPPLCNSCQSGYTLQKGACTLNPPALSISASKSRVAKNATTTISWSASGLVSGAGIACSVTSSPAGVYSATMPTDTTPTWSGSNQITGPITSATVFTLSCTGSTPVSTTVNLIPAFKEI